MDSSDVTVHLERLKESFLWAAAKGGRLQEVASLLDLGADVDWVVCSSDSTNNTNRYKDTPLLTAVRAGHTDVSALLLAHGADPSRKSGNGGETALHLAAATGDEDLCTLLTREGGVCPLTSVNDMGKARKITLFDIQL